MITDLQIPVKHIPIFIYVQYLNFFFTKMWKECYYYFSPVSFPWCHCHSTSHACCSLRGSTTIFRKKQRHISIMVNNVWQMEWRDVNVCVIDVQHTYSKWSAFIKQAGRNRWLIFFKNRNTSILGVYGDICFLEFSPENRFTARILLFAKKKMSICSSHC